MSVRIIYITYKLKKYKKKKHLRRKYFTSSFWIKIFHPYPFPLILQKKSIPSYSSQKYIDSFTSSIFIRAFSKYGEFLFRRINTRFLIRYCWTSRRLYGYCAFSASVFLFYMKQIRFHKTIHLTFQHFQLIWKTREF